MLPLPPLGELELAVLEHLWTEGEATVADVHMAVGKPRRSSKNTVGSAMERLYRKRLLRRRKVSHAYVYAPAIERERFHVRRMAEAAGGVDALRDAGVLAAFVDVLAEDEETLDELSALIRDRKRRSR